MELVVITTYLIGLIVLSIATAAFNPRFTPWMLLAVLAWPLVVPAVVWTAVTMSVIWERTEREIE